MTLTLPAPHVYRPAYDPSLLRPRLPDWCAEWMKPGRYKSIDGGRGSAKSHSIAQMAILRMANMVPAYQDGFRPVRIVSARAVEGHIKESVKQVVEDYITVYGLDRDFTIQDQIIYHRNGSQMTFPGIDHKLEAFLSMERIDVLWVEQAESLTDKQMQKIVPTVARVDGAEMWFVWNPCLRTDWAWQRFKVKSRPDDLILTANWRNNPWWNAALEDERLATLNDESIEVYNWIWEGQPFDGDGSTIVLPRILLDKCMEAWPLRPDLSGDWAHAGLDFAFGGADKCALVVRQGPVVHGYWLWPGEAGDMSVATERAWDLCLPYDIARIYYDGSAEARKDLLDSGFSGVRAVNFGGAVGGPDDLYERNRPNKEVFARRNMQMAMGLRLRANRTWRLLKGDPEIDPDDCLFLPPDLTTEAILTDLGQPTRRHNQSRGLWELEKAAVGERSPDVFDGVCLSFGYDTDDRGLRAR